MKATDVLKHLIIPDTQVRPGVDVDHLEWAGNYAVEKQPQVIVHLGDHWDMPSLSRWDNAARKALASRDVHADIVAGNEALRLFMRPITEHNKGRRSRARYKPRLVMLEGNHEHRIARSVYDEPWLAGLFEACDRNDRELGWERIPFLQPIEIDGIRYCHYFCRNANGAVVQSRNGMPSAKAQVVRECVSATAGHKQGLDVHVQPAGGRIFRGLIAGSFYSHDEEYLTPQGNTHFRGILLKNDVRDGYYDLCDVSLDFLRRRYS